MNIRFFKSRSEFRNWLESAAQKNGELWIGFYKKSSGRPSITYSESVDEALCFGWIDGLRKSVDADAYAVRFTPRKPGSQWSAINLQRVQKLTAAGAMRPAGLKAFDGATSQSRKYSYEQRHHARFDKQAERQFHSHPKAWDFFQVQPPWYRRTATFWVVSAKKEETRQKRLGTLIRDSESGQSIKPLQRPPVPKRQKKRN